MKGELFIYIGTAESIPVALLLQDIGSKSTDMLIADSKIEVLSLIDTACAYAYDLATGIQQGTAGTSV